MNVGDNTQGIEDAMDIALTYFNAAHKEMPKNWRDSITSRGLVAFQAFQLGVITEACKLAGLDKDAVPQVHSLLLEITQDYPPEYANKRADDISAMSTLQEHCMKIGASVLFYYHHANGNLQKRAAASKMWVTISQTLESEEA